jgi:hypothetical protein
MDRRKRLLTIAIVLLSAGGMSIGSAQPNKEQYELQERCGKRAAQVWEKDYGANVINTKDGPIIINYENHYNARLNKCFFLEISVSYEQRNNRTTTTNSWRLYDLNDNKKYGEFMSGLDNSPFPFLCEIQTSSGSRYTCHSENEWRVLLKQYMEN